ncbi:MAG: hypothetical protein R6V02_07655, partial [Candidatus Aminicenantes bacterium]
MEATAGSAVVVNSGLNNIFVTNGRIQNTSSEAVNVQSPSQQLVLKDLDIDNTTGGVASHGIS